MEYLGICGFVAVCSGILLLLSKREKELSSIISALLYIFAALFVLDRAKLFIEGIRRVFPMDGIPYASTLLRSGGLAAVAAVCSSVCESAGQKEIANIVELMTVMEILLLALPIFTDLLSQLMKIFGD